MSCPHCSMTNMTASCLFCRPEPSFYIKRCPHTDDGSWCDRCTYEGMRNAYSQENDKPNKHIGSSLDDWLEEEGLLNREKMAEEGSKLGYYDIFLKKTIWQKIKELFK